MFHISFSNNSFCSANTIIKIGIYGGAEVTGNTFSPSSAGVGTYTLTYNFTDINNCSNNATHTVTVQSCISTNINSFSNESSLMIYPNPFTNEIQIISQNSIKSIFIYDLIGNKIKEFSSLNNLEKLSINLNELSTGIYFAEINFTDNSTVIQKINKQAE